ncbi:MAG: hypothetical protein NTW87_05490 [Planctomycetota bacterium]|nr:hypothetical protein [Planctomycetota bacterium]
MERSEFPGVTEEDFERIAEESAKEFAIIASEAGVSVQELFEGLGRTLKRLNALRRAREAGKMDVEEPT